MSSIIFLVRSFCNHLIRAIIDHFVVKDTYRIQAAETVSVDTLFAAFEKFLEVAWKEHMGPLLPASVI